MAHSPQCTPLIWAALVVAAPQTGEQITVLANAMAQDVGWFDSANALALSALKARITLIEPGATGAKRVHLYSNQNASLTVIVPWTKVRVEIDELSGFDAYAWVLSTEKLEPSTSFR